MSHTNNKEVEELVTNIQLEVVECVYGMNLDISSKEAKRLYSELGNSPLLRKNITQLLHQELQKARHDWLREEIVKLEGMNREDEIFDSNKELDKEYNLALQTIIDRYSSELDQPNNK